MRLDLNLATHPYLSVRTFFIKWATTLGVAAVVTVALVWIAVASWLNTRAINRQIAEKRAAITRLQQEERAAVDILEQDKNLGVRRDSLFVNQLIARKAFSWTQAFSDLEKLMPARIRVTSIRPQLNADNQLEIHMTVTGDSHDKAMELLRHMEDSQHFREAQLRSETSEIQSGNLQSGSLQFQISALYVPAAQPVGGTP